MHAASELLGGKGDKNVIMLGGLAREILRLK